MTSSEKKQEILNVIFERACELEEKAIEILTLTSKPENIDYESLTESALKKAFQEWKDNKPVFNKPSFL
jgi:hypothetical protein